MWSKIYTVIFFCILSAATAAYGAEFEVHPSIALSGEYTDNVYETGTNRSSDYITRVLPGIAMSYKARLLTADLSYLFDYRDYARDVREDENTHALSASGHLTAIENLLFLDVRDEYRRVSLDVTRDLANESLFFNQSDQNVATISPYLTLRPMERISVKTGYTFVDTRYIDSPAIDKNDHIAFVNLAYEMTKRLSLTADYTYTRQLADIDDLRQHYSLAGFRYEYSNKSFLFAQGGKAWTYFDSGPRLDSVIWNAGFSHVVDTISATVTTGVRYNEDPLRNVTKESYISGKLEKQFVRGAVSFSPIYSRYVLTNTDTLLLEKYGAAVRGRYDLSADLNCFLGLGGEVYDLPDPLGYTRRIQTDTGLSYLLAKGLTLSLTYIFTGYSSPTIIADNRHVNRAMFEIKKTF